MRDFLEALTQPEYVHVLLNPLPVYGLAMALLVFASALILRNKPAQVIALILLIIICVSSWPVFHYGEAGYKRVRSISDEEGQRWLDAHMDRAHRFIYSFFITAGFAAAALVALKKFPKAFSTLAALTLLSEIGSLTIGGWISDAGGKIRHSEFRRSPAPQEPVSHEHNHNHH